MTTAIARAEVHAEAHTALVERVAIMGDLKDLTAQERVRYYLALCDSLSLNPLTKPFEYLTLGSGKQEKLVLYPTRTATDQIAERNGISFPEYRDEMRDTVYIYHARATDKTGRTLWRTGVVPIVKEGGAWSGPDGNRRFTPDGTFTPLSPADLANAMMKAETKAYRRATLAIAGLGWMDESEIETVKEARRVQVNMDTGEIVDGQVVVAPTDPDAAQAAANKARFARLAAAARARNIAAPHLDKTMTPSQVADVLTAWEDAINAA